MSNVPKANTGMSWPELRVLKGIFVLGSEAISDMISLLENFAAVVKVISLVI
jgi:uncharacterized Fe-S cluster-containing MiaB family protein